MIETETVYIEKNVANEIIPSTPAPGGEILFFQTEDGRTRLEVRLQAESVWLSLNQLAELFQRDKSVVSKHIKNVFEEGELRPEATVAKFATVQTEGGRTVSREIEFYNLDVIISVGYRVKSHRGTQFRIWATWTALVQKLWDYGNIFRDDCLFGFPVCRKIRALKAGDEVLVSGIVFGYGTVRTR